MRKAHPRDKKFVIGPAIKFESGFTAFHPFDGEISCPWISYLKLSGSRQSKRPSSVSACGYIRKPTGAPFEPGSATSCAKLYAIQFISQAPNKRERAVFTISSSSGRFPGGSSSTTLRTSAGSTGTHPYSRR